MTERNRGKAFGGLRASTCDQISDHDPGANLNFKTSVLFNDYFYSISCAPPYSDTGEPGVPSRSTAHTSRLSRSLNSLHCRAADGGSDGGCDFVVALKLCIKKSIAPTLHRGSKLVEAGETQGLRAHLE